MRIGGDLFQFAHQPGVMSSEGCGQAGFALKLKGRLVPEGSEDRELATEPALQGGAIKGKAHGWLVWFCETFATYANAMRLQVICKTYIWPVMMEISGVERVAVKTGQIGIGRAVTAGLAMLLLAACATSAVGTAPAAGRAQTAPATAAAPAAADPLKQARYEQDRKAILAMAGDYDIDFDFIETVAFAPGYELKPDQLSGGEEVVRVIEDRGDFISLQHILVVGRDQKMPIKHWRQDWKYEPESVLIFTGGNAWEMRPVPAAERAGRWSQTVYQVEDSPRYGAVGAWSHENGISEWTGRAEWRPLPRREATSRKDYDVVIAVNRHAITPAGWVHEQDNSKLSLRDGRRQIIARETGLNTYTKDSRFPAKVATDYWDATKDYWAIVRAEWTRLEKAGPSFGLTVQGEPEPLYMPLLDLADKVQAGEMTVEAAGKDAAAVIAKFTTSTPAPLAERIAAAAR